MQVDFKLINIRVKFLNEKKELLESAITKCTSSYQEHTGTDSNDKMEKYLQKLADIEEELGILEQEKVKLEQGLVDMKKAYKQAVGIERDVFKLYFIEAKHINDIAKAVGKTSRMIYKYIDDISQKYKLDE